MASNNSIMKFFPFSGMANTIANLIISIVIYIVAGAVLGVVAGILGGIISILGWILGIVTSLYGLYALIGIILAILRFCEKV